MKNLWTFTEAGCKCVYPGVKGIMSIEMSNVWKIFQEEVGNNEKPLKLDVIFWCPVGDINISDIYY